MNGSILNDTGASIQSGGTLALTSTASSVTNRGTLTGEGAVNIDAATFIHNESSGRIESDGDITLDAQGGEIENTGEIAALGNVSLTASTDVTNGTDATLTASQSLTVTTADNINNNGVLAGEDSATLNATNLINNGALKSHGDLTATVSNNLVNTQTIHTRGDLALYVANLLQNDEGTIEGYGDVTLQKNIAGDKTTTVENISGTIQAGNKDYTDSDLVIRAENLKNRKKTFETATRTDPGENGNITYKVEYVKTDSDAGRILAERDLTLYGGDITNSQSQIHANRNLSIPEGNVTNETTDLTTTKKTRTKHTRTWKKCKWYGSCTTYHETYYTTSSQLQPDKTQTVYGTLSARETLDLDVGTLALTGVSLTTDRVGLVGGDIDVSTSGADSLIAADNLTTRFSVPEGKYGKFISRPGVTAKYLIEINPLFADKTTFMGSDYFIKQTGIDPDEVA